MTKAGERGWRRKRVETRSFLAGFLRKRAHHMLIVPTAQQNYVPPDRHAG